MDQYEKHEIEFESLRKAFGDSIDGTIYHYTTAEGLRGIIENYELWLTNASFVNDREECELLKKESNLSIEGELRNSSVKQAWDKFIKGCSENNVYIGSLLSKITL